MSHSALEGCGRSLEILRPSGEQREADAYEYHHFCIADMWRIRKKTNSRPIEACTCCLHRTRTIGTSFTIRLHDVGMLTASKKDQVLFRKAQIITTNLIPQQVIVKQQQKTPRIEMRYPMPQRPGSNPPMRQAFPGAVAPGSAF